MRLLLALFFLSSWGLGIQKAFADTPLLFVPGIKGTILRGEDRSLDWVSFFQAFKLATSDLALPLEWKHGKQRTDHHQAAEVMTQFVYGPWIKKAAETGRPFYAFGYDWRRDPLETLDLFERYVEGIYKENHETKIQVVGHSFGGLLTLALLHKRPEFFQSVVFVGVPFKGTLGFWPDLQEGSTVGINEDLLASEVLFSFPSVYALFPEDAHGLVITSDDKPMDMDFYSASTWKNHRLSVFYDFKNRTYKKEIYLAEALEHAKEFRENLAPRARTYPPITVLYGNAYPTLARVIQNGPKARRGWDFDSLPREPGDGRVCAKDAFPPIGIPYEGIASENEHSQLMSDPKLIEAVNKLYQSH